MVDEAKPVLTTPSIEQATIEEDRHRDLMLALGVLAMRMESHKIFLKSMDDRQQEALEDSKRKELAGSVTDGKKDDSGSKKGAGTGKPATGGKNSDGDGDGGIGVNAVFAGGLFSGLAGLMGGTVAAMGGKDSKGGGKGLFKTLAKKVVGLGIASAIAPAFGNFIEGATKNILDKMEVDTEVGDDIASSINFASVNAIFAAMINRRFALPAFLASLGYKLAEKLDEIDGEDDGIVAGVEVSDETMGLVGGALGIGIGVYLQNKIIALSKAAGEKLKNLKPTINPAVVDDIVDVADSTPAGGANDTKTNNNKPDKPSGGGANDTKQPKVSQDSNKLNKKITDLRNKGIKPEKIPGFMNFNSAGQAINPDGTFASNQKVKDALAQLSKMNIAKYAGVLKFAGAAATIGFSMVDVYDAIANDKGEDEIQKQIAGALGSIGGGLTGAKIGMLIGAVGGPVGSFLTALVMGGVGALRGEDIAEMIAEYVVTGESAALENEISMLAGATSQMSTASTGGFLGNPSVMGRGMMEQAKQRDFKSFMDGEMSLEVFSSRYRMSKADQQKIEDHISKIKQAREIADSAPTGLGILKPEFLPAEMKVETVDSFQLKSGMLGGNGAGINAQSNFTPVDQSQTNIGGSSQSIFTVINNGSNSLGNSDQSLPFNMAK
jgi:hypothetical protein